MIIRKATGCKEKYFLYFVQKKVHENNLHFFKLLGFSSLRYLYFTIEILE